MICTTPAAFLTLTISPERKKKVGFSVFRAISNNLELMGFALNFFVYCLCSADIRRAFVDVLFDNCIVVWIRRHFAKSSASATPDYEMTEHNLAGKLFFLYHINLCSAQ